MASKGAHHHVSRFAHVGTTRRKIDVKKIGNRGEKNIKFSVGIVSSLLGAIAAQFFIFGYFKETVNLDATVRTNYQSFHS